jgi:Acetyltransferase (GNAT) domain
VGSASAGLAVAELLSDGGAAALSDDLFRSAAYLEAEGATHTLRVAFDGGESLVPLIVREIEGSDRIDAISPYGYPGGLVDGDPPGAEGVDWTATGLVSIFGRERLAAAPWLAGASHRGRVHLHDPAKPRNLRSRLAEQARANERDGWATAAIAGPAAPTPDRVAFAAAYEQTMRRAEAAERYFFAPSYFDAVLSFERSWLLVARNEDEVGAAAIAAVSDDLLHYFLGGTADSARSASPFKNVVVAMLDLADDLGLTLNLGGGITPGDGLDEFKRGFANAELEFFTQEVVCDPAAYAELAGDRDVGAFFPVYRA